MDLFWELLLIVTTGQPKWQPGLHHRFHLIIMGVALDAIDSQAHWQHLKNMSADTLELLSVFFPNDWIATFVDIVVPLPHPLSVLQEARRHALTRQAFLRRKHAYGPSAASLVASDEIPPLESANQHPAPSQKPPTSKQSTSPAAPASAPPLLSTSKNLPKSHQ